MNFLRDLSGPQVSTVQVLNGNFIRTNNRAGRDHSARRAQIAEEVGEFSS